jgi:hypothetical protein
MAELTVEDLVLERIARLVAFATARLDEAASCDTGGGRALEVEALRGIFTEHQPEMQRVEWPHDQTGTGKAMVCPRCQNADNDAADWHPAYGQAGVFPYEPFTVGYELAPCRTVRLLLAPYAGHDDYDEEWRP